MNIMLVFYNVVAIRYKHHTREEVSDVKAHRIIEEYCERHITKDEAGEREHFLSHM